METNELMRDVFARTNGEFYLGVVGAVRTGKSTFIKKFMEALVLPLVDDEDVKKRMIDVLPQSANGKTIMTTEPKFVPNNPVNIGIEGEVTASVQLIDCVGYVIPTAEGYETEEGPRMVTTPWYDEPIPFVEAAAIGTQKVIEDHSHIGIVMTTDGSIGNFKREDYLEAEGLVIEQLKAINKPFIIVLNSTHPKTEDVLELRDELQAEHGVPVLPLSVENMTKKDIFNVLREALYEFPVTELDIKKPAWVDALADDNWLKSRLLRLINQSVNEFYKLRDINYLAEELKAEDVVEDCYISALDAGLGLAELQIKVPDELYDQILTELVGPINDKADLMRLLQDYATIKVEYEPVASALQQVKQTGYGIATPCVTDMTLTTPEVVRAGARYGVKLKALAPSIHMIRVDVESVFEPIIGTEQQSKDLIEFILKDADKNPLAIWQTEIFGRCLSDIVKDGISAKLYTMPENARHKLQETLIKIVNEGSGGLIAIML
ncbi:MAG TPA: stage IV sporulation protein A [Firmicutes bacterium]|nr:stage IV sporulation protein A [Bacillota bacterium]